MALVTTCICYCILHFAWHVRVTKTHAGCTATALMEQTRETAVLPKPLTFVLVHLPSHAGTRNIAKKKLSCLVFSGRGVYKSQALQVALMKKLLFFSKNSGSGGRLCDVQVLRSQKQKGYSLPTVISELIL